MYKNDVSVPHLHLDNSGIYPKPSPRPLSITYLLRTAAVRVVPTSYTQASHSPLLETTWRLCTSVMSKLTLLLLPFLRSGAVYGESREASSFGAQRSMAVAPCHTLGSTTWSTQHYPSTLDGPRSRLPYSNPSHAKQEIELTIAIIYSFDPPLPVVAGHTPCLYLTAPCSHIPLHLPG